MNRDATETISAAADLISRKWHPVIIQTLLADGPLRFSELENRHEVSAKVLTDSLDDLVENGLVRRVVVSESPRRVEYELTEEGEAMQSVIEALASWGETHLGESDRPVVLVVDNDPRLVSMHAGWLEDDYNVVRAYDGDRAMEALDDDVDVVLLDRRMPGLSGSEVLEQIRRYGYDCNVIMVSAVTPDFDVIEMGFDDYLVKPATKTALREAVEDVLSRRAYDRNVYEYLSLQARAAVLEAEKPAEVLADNEDYQQLVARLEELAATVDDESANSDAIRAMLNSE